MSDDANNQVKGGISGIEGRSPYTSRLQSSPPTCRKCSNQGKGLDLDSKPYEIGMGICHPSLALQAQEALEHLVSRICPRVCCNTSSDSMPL